MKHQSKQLKNTLNKTLEKFFSEGKTRFYLSEFASEAKTSIHEAENFIIPLLKEDELEGKLEVRCPNCGKDIEIYRRFIDIPDEIECEICGYRFHKSLEYIEIILEMKRKFFRARRHLRSRSNRTNYK